MEDWHIKTELSSTISHTFHYTTRRVGVRPALLDYKIVQSIDVDKKLQFQLGHQEFVCTLFKPTDTNYPYINYIIFDPNKELIIFKKITVSDIITHCDRKVVSDNGKDVYADEIVKFFFYKSYYWDQNNVLQAETLPKTKIDIDLRSQAVALLEFIFGEKGFAIQLCEGEKIVNVNDLKLFSKQEKHVTYTYEDKVQLKVLKPDGSTLQEVLYLYGSGATTEENDGARGYFIENIGFYGKETCEEAFHILFSK